MTVLTVSQLNRYVASVMRGDIHLRTIFLRGEISGFKRNTASGHCYLTLKDAGASVRAVMFRGNAERLRFAPKDGLHVIVQGQAELYERDGAFQVKITDMHPDGIGEQALALQQLCQKLAAKGYFAPERKRPVPKMPRKIGIVTSQNAAALQDMLNVIGRRWPLCTVCLYHAAVQGDSAPDSIAQALHAAGSDRCDVILMGRGGGSREELAAFQAEIVADAVFASPVPVISAVGHETDFCIADAVADLRAPTPSAAAELAVPDQNVIRAGIAGMQEQLASAFRAAYVQKYSDYEKLRLRLEKNSPENVLMLREEQLSGLKKRLDAAAARCLAQAEQKLAVQLERLSAYSPTAVLQRGYALAYSQNSILRDAAALHTGEEVEIRLARGRFRASVSEVFPQTAEQEGSA